jgi:hypothetical protein
VTSWVRRRSLRLPLSDSELARWAGTASGQDPPDTHDQANSTPSEEEPASHCRERVNAARRRNAQKSTGPRTRAGKRRVAQSPGPDSAVLGNRCPYRNPKSGPH